MHRSLVIKFINSEKVTKFWEISTLLLTGTTLVKSKVEISQNFVAFSEYMNFNPKNYNILFIELKVQFKKTTKNK